VSKEHSPRITLAGFGARLSWSSFPLILRRMPSAKEGREGERRRRKKRRGEKREGTAVSSAPPFFFHTLQRCPLFCAASSPCEEAIDDPEGERKKKKRGKKKGKGENDRRLEWELREKGHHTVDLADTPPRVSTLFH